MEKNFRWSVPCPSTLRRGVPVELNGLHRYFPRTPRMQSWKHAGGKVELVRSVPSSPTPPFFLGRRPKLSVCVRYSSYHHSNRKEIRYCSNIHRKQQGSPGRGGTMLKECISGSWHHTLSGRLCWFMEIVASMNSPSIGSLKCLLFDRNNPGYICWPGSQSGLSHCCLP